MLRRLLAAFACSQLGQAGAGAEDNVPISHYDQVAVPTSKTSIYVGTVTLTMPAFARKNGVYRSPYSAKVFPYFFYNEAGTLAVEMSDEQLRQLERGQPIDFFGRAVRSDGTERRLTGRATPRNASSGKLKVRVLVSNQTELIFNTTYQFGLTAPPSLGPAR